MLKEREKELKQLQDELLKLEHDKKITQEMLEEKRKQEEKKYLHPILEREEECKSRLSLIQQSIVDDVCGEIDELASKDVSKKESSRFEGLLNDFAEVMSFKGTLLQALIEKAQVLYDYFLKTEKVDSAATFLKYRSGSAFKRKYYDKERAKYLQVVTDFTAQPQYTDASRPILSYGKYRPDILKLMQLCGALDARSAPEDSKGIYYSPKTKELIISGAIGEFGNLVQYIYCDGEFGHYESDRDTLMYWHEKGYKEEQQKMQEKSETHTI